VIVTVVTPIGKQSPFLKPAVGAVVRLKVGVLQLSEAVGAIQVAFAQVPAVDKLILVGHPVITGAVASVAQGSAPQLVGVPLNPMHKSA
jgi:hypothetical protein